MKKPSSASAPKIDPATFSLDNDANDTLNLYQSLIDLPDAVIITDLSFTISGWNESAEKIYGLPGAKGKNLLSIVDIEVEGSDTKSMLEAFYEQHSWKGNIRYKRFDGTTLLFYTSLYQIINEEAKPVSIVITNHNISRQLIAEKKLSDAEAVCQLIMNHSTEGVLVIDSTGHIKACNKRATEILTLTEEQLLGKMPISSGWKVYRPDGRIFPDSELPAIVSLQTGFPQKNVLMRLSKNDTENSWLCVNSQALIRPGEFSPYAVVVHFAATQAPDGSGVS